MLRTACEYSEKEMKLFSHFGIDDLAPHLEPTGMYRLAVEKAFLTNDQTVFAESLRRCVEVINRGYKHELFRMTPAWDALIEVEVV